MNKLKTLALVGALTAVGTFYSHAQNLVADGDFTANASAFVTAPGLINVPTGSWPNNPAAIAGWTVSPYGGTDIGVNGTGAGSGYNVFGPYYDGGHTYAFVKTSGSAIYQFVALSPNTTYALEFDAAGRPSGDASTFSVRFGDPFDTFWSSGSVAADYFAFTHYSYTFTTPGSLAMPTIQLWNDSSSLGDTTVNFANVSLIALPQPARATLVSDNFSTADANNDLNANLATRQGGNLATTGYYWGCFPPDAIGITNNAIMLSSVRTDYETPSQVILNQNLFSYEVSNSFRVECDVNITTGSASPSSWAAVSVCGGAELSGLTEGFHILIQPYGDYCIYNLFDGGTAVGVTMVYSTNNHHVVIDVSNNVARVNVNRMAVPFAMGTYSHTITSAATGATNYVSFRLYANTGATPSIATFDNLVVSTAPVTTPAPTLVNPAYNLGIGTASFQFNSVAQGFYVLESKTSLTDPTWTKVANIAGTGGVQTVSFPSASPTAFFRLRVPVP